MQQGKKSAFKAYFSKPSLTSNTPKANDRHGPFQPRQKINCPVCSVEIEFQKINEHLDEACLRLNKGDVAVPVAVAVPGSSGLGDQIITTDGNCDNPNPSSTSKRLKLNPFNERKRATRDSRSEAGSADSKCQVFSEPTKCQHSGTMHKSSTNTKQNNASSSKAIVIDDCEDSPMTDGDCCQTIEDKESQIEFQDAETIKQEHENYAPYYLANFKFIIDFGLQYDGGKKKLFNQEDRLIVDVFNSLKQESQLLYVRLFLRKSMWFKCAKLSYPDIGQDLSPFLSDLVSNGLLVDNESLDEIKEILNLLSAAEVRCLCRSLQLFKDKSGQMLTSKSDHVDAILSHGNNQQSILSFTTWKSPSKNPLKASIVRSAKKYLGECVKVASAPKELFSRFFNLVLIANYPPGSDDNAFQSLIYKILLINKKEIVYSPYTVSSCLSIFSNRDEFVHYSEALALEQELSSLLDEKKFTEALSIYETAKIEFTKVLALLSNQSELKNPVGCGSGSPFLLRFSAEWVYTRVCGKCVEVLEKNGKYGAAVDLLKSLLSQNVYCTSSRGFFWERLTIDVERYMKNPAMALDCIKTALEDPFVRTGKRLGIIARATRICNNKKNKLLKIKLPDVEMEECNNDVKEVTITASLYLDTSSAQRAVFLSSEPAKNGHTDETNKIFTDVEKCALLHYKKSGYPKGVHAESASYTMIFALLFWDVIFMDIADAFVGPYQACPLDFFTDYFYEKRKKKIDKRLEKIRTSSNEDLRQLIYDSWTQHEGHCCVGANWKIFDSVKDIMDVISCLGGIATSGICELLCKDYKDRCSGMPDLLVWNPSTCLCKAVEVKGPGDKLSHKQALVEKGNCFLKVLQLSNKFQKRKGGTFVVHGW
eukprot:gene9457-10445_t